MGFIPRRKCRKTRRRVATIEIRSLSPTRKLTTISQSAIKIRVSAKAIITLCIAILAAGCSSPLRAPHQANDPKTEQNIQAEHKRIVSLMAQSAADARIKELKPQLDLTAEQESAFRKAYIQQLVDALEAVFYPLMHAEAAPPSAPEQHHFQSERDLLKPLLTPKQLAAYDAFKAQQRKEQTLKTAAERVDRLDSSLGLTDDKRNEVFEIFAISEEQRLEAMDNDQPAVPPDQENEMFRDVLTASQFEHYQKLCLSERPNNQMARTTFLIPPLLFPVSAPSMPAGGFHVHR